MNTLQSLGSVWILLANSFNVTPPSINTFNKRLDGEHINFLVTILPSLGKDVDRSLTSGKLEVTSRFKLKRNTVLPVFLHELFIRAYNKDGTLRCPDEIRCIRQLLLMFYKFEVDSDPEKDQEAFMSFVARDEEVKTSDWPSTIPAIRSLVKSVLPDSPLDIRPHHSSGHTADRYSNSEKRYKRRFLPGLSTIYGPEYFFQNYSHFLQWRKDNPYTISTPSARITCVPKDSRGPRVICMEPHERMFIQKGIMQLIYDHIETVSPAKGYINFTDQMVNRRLAHEASISGRYATIDLKDASDMVSWDLVKLVFPISWIAALSATRSTHVKIGDLNHLLQKFAPMGSALCFPIEAILFWAISRTICDEVWVYGDDIIVANKDATKVMSALESYGLIVNKDKSLYTGFFRESCGGEYVLGHDIAITRLKSLDLVSYVDFCNLITESYGEETSRVLISIGDKMSPDGCIRREPLHCADNAKPLVYYTSYNAASSVFFKSRYNRDLQINELRSPIVVNKVVSDPNLSELDALFDWFTLTERSTTPADAHAMKRLEFEFGSHTTWQRTNTTSGLEVIPHSDHNSWSSNTSIKFGWAETFSDGPRMDVKHPIFRNYINSL